MTLARHGVWLFGLVLVAATVPAVRESPGATYGGSDPWLLWVETGVAGSLLLVGAVDVFRHGRVGMSLLGALWLVPELAGWIYGDVAVRTGADAGARLLPAVAALLLLRTAPLPGRWARAITVAVLAGGVSSATARLLLVDPFLDPECWRTCDHNPLLLVQARDVGQWLDRGGLALLTAAAAVTVGSLLARGSRSVPLAAAGSGVFGALCAAAVTRWWVPEAATSTTYVALFLLAQAAALATAVVVALEHHGEWRLRLRLTGLAAGLQSSPAPGALADALGRAVGDRHLRIDYWVPQRATFVDADGREVTGPPAGDSRVTLVARRDQRVARLIHSADVDGDRVDGALGAALRLSLENEQLRAATLAELHELQTSRARIVERAADERRRLERNLHDGAQQRVVALSLLVRMLRSRVGDGVSAVDAARAEVLTKAALGELRRIARGIYPAVLADAGLSGAVLDLAQSSTDVAVSVDRLPGVRYHGTVETTAFLVVDAALRDARARRATCLNVSVVQRGGVLVADLRDDAPPGHHHHADSLRDQVGALLGCLRFASHEGWTTVRLELPCAS